MPGQNKKGQNIFRHRFLNPFLQQATEKKDSKNSAARKLFGRSYFVMASAEARDKITFLSKFSWINPVCTDLLCRQKDILECSCSHVSIAEARIGDAS